MQDEDVDMLRGMFDHLDISTIKKVLAEENGNVERAIDSLLNVAAIESQDGGALDSGGAASGRTPPQQEGKRNGEHADIDQDALLAAVSAYRRPDASNDCVHLSYSLFSCSKGIS